MRTPVCLFAALFFGLAGCGKPSAPPAAPSIEAPREFKFDILDVGVYETLGDTVIKAAPSTAAGRVSEHEGLNLLGATDRLRAQRGVVFGYRYRIVGQLQGEADDFEMHVIHPSMRGVDGKFHTSQTAPIKLFFENGAVEDHIVYTLREAFEVLPGTWTLQIRFKGTPVITKSFTLTP
jgi:hypothetical protein